MTEITLYPLEDEPVTISVDELSDVERLHISSDMPYSLKQAAEGDNPELTYESVDFFLSIIVERTEISWEFVDQLPMSEITRLVSVSAQLYAGEDLDVPPSTYSDSSSSDYRVDSDNTIDFSDGSVDLDDWR